MMLSLPEDWDYTIAGLTKFTSDGRVCVANTIRELEEHGYIKRRQNRGENGAFAQNVYWIYEVPQTEDDSAEADNTDTAEIESVNELPTEMESMTENMNTESEAEVTSSAEGVDAEKNSEITPCLPCPQSVNPSADFPSTANNAQQIKDKQITEKQNLIRYDLMRAQAEVRVEYAVLREEFSKERLDELVDLIVEMESCQSDTMLIAGAVYPREIVAARMQALNAECIRYVLDCLREVKPQIKNMKKYLMASLFNAPATMENFMESRVQREVFAKMNTKNTETGGINA
ncbi:MAG: hypothetical protein IJ302_05370 [Clostridia bacterium]|nr:hypothetical protein [Clostridia bacterium]